MIGEVFGATGYLARATPGYEMREGQVALATAVDGAVARGEHLLAEAPCGTGKSIAYLVPSIWHAVKHRRQVVIATATNALSEQLVAKDLPALAKALPWGFSYALLKGRGNYACRHALSKLDPNDLSVDEEEQIDEIRTWVSSTRTGDLRELPWLPSARVLEQITSTNDACGRRDCPSFEQCFYEAAKERARSADVLVTNYHLLFASIDVAQKTGKHVVLPPLDVVVMDEAHEAPDIAREFFGYALGARAFGRLAVLANDIGQPALGQEIQMTGLAFLDGVKQRCKPGRYVGGSDLGDDAILALLRQLVALLGAGDASQFARLTTTRIEDWVGCRSPGRVYWVDVSDRGYTSLHAREIEPGRLLNNYLFGAAKAVIACSATLTVNGSFDFARKELGVPANARELEVPSPFDFPAQGRLVVATDLPDPREPTFPGAACAALARVVDACRGRTLALFTSKRAVEEAHAFLTPRLRGRYRLLKQGDLPRGELVRIFREDIHSVLLATQSFWTGINIPGEALTGLVIDKLPFPSPTDPVLQALSERQPDAFGTYSVPKAALLLKQGVGRLIRSRTDSGVVVLLDKRVITMGYGRRMLRALPPMPISHDLGAISRLLDRKESAA